MSVNDFAADSHYPLCVKYISNDDLPCICDLLDEHATLIRADERGQVHATIQAGEIPGSDVPLVEEVADMVATGAGRWLVVTSRGVFGPFDTWAAAAGWGTDRYGRMGGFSIEILSRPEEWRAEK